MFYIAENGALYHENGGLIVQDQNPMHQEYLEWLEEGNTPGEWNNNG